MVNSDLSNLVITRVIAVHRLYSNSGNFISGRTNREHWALILKYKGKTVYQSGGKQYFSDALHPVVLPRGSSYTWQCTEQGDFYVIEFDANLSFTEIFSFEIADNNIFLKNLAKIEKALALRPETSGVQTILAVYSILCFLLDSEEKYYSPEKTKNTIKPAIDYMVMNYNNPDITNEQLAKLCNISTVYFRKTFYNIYKVPPMKYLQGLRIEKAKRLLESDYESIGQIAESVGFNSIYHFSKTFKLCTGVAPTKYS